VNMPTNMGTPIRTQRLRRYSRVPYFWSIMRPKKPEMRKNRGMRKLCSQSWTHREALEPPNGPGGIPPMNIRKMSAW
jgi:hypothetical protein